jgi:hypothetical protein
MIYIFTMRSKKRTKFGKLSLMEGLIYTYPIDKSIRILVKRFPELKIEIEHEGELFIVGFNDKLNSISLNKLYSDINFREGGYYTVDNIGVEHINLIKEIKF